MSNKTPKTILVPVDGSEGAGNAARLAIGLAERLSVPVQLLYTFPENAMGMYGIPSGGRKENQIKHFAPSAFDEMREEAKTRVFRAAREAIGETSVPIEEKLLIGKDSAETIVEHAAKMEDPLIVIGRRGLSHVREVLVGSTSQRVVHQAKCPVLVAR